ncbi:MAG: hypothetical protein ACR2J6_08785 [Thermoleophilaceae bacterium]
MFQRRILVPALLACTALGLPAAADAATLAPEKPCYDGDDLIKFGGAGSAPKAPIAAALGGQALQGTVTTNATGAFLAKLAAPFLTTATERVETLTASDGVNVGTTGVRRSIVRVLVRPANASPYRTRRFSARGFTTGKTLYRHVVRGKRVSNSRQGRLKGACHTLSYKRRLFRRSAKTGTYRVQFDTSRKYSSKRLQRFRFRVRVYRIVRRASAATASAATAGGTAEQWTQVKQEGGEAAPGQTSTSGYRVRRCSASVWRTRRLSSALAIR